MVHIITWERLGMESDFAQEWLDVSGVLTVMTLGMFYAAVARTAFRGDGQQSLHHFWEMIAYIANTLIFILSNIMMEFRKEMKPVADQLLHYLLKSLDISDEDIKIWAASTNKVQGPIQLNSYPPCPDPSRVLGLAPHTDTMLLTILNQCQIPGLQVFRDDVGWISVPPVPGALTVNVGDILHILSNGKFQSVYHRVTVSEKKHRISIVYLLGPSVDSHIEPLNKLEKPLYRSMSVKDFLVIKAKHNEKALSFVKM